MGASHSRRAAGLLGVLAFVLVLGASPAQADTATFNYTGGQQEFRVPAGVTTLNVVAVGGKGGAGPAGVPGGRGALMTADIAVTPGEILYIIVGGNANSSGSPQCCLAAFNGGGAGGDGAAADGGGGGGASDVRRIPIGANNSLASRVVVAGAGGGGAGAAGGDAGSGGASCATCAAPGAAGTSSAGGGGGGPGGNGQLGDGGDGGSSNALLTSGGGGGGGGYHGGGGGGVGGAAAAGGAGGGGSSFAQSGGSLALDVSGVPSVKLTFTPATGPSYPLPPSGNPTQQTPAQTPASQSSNLQLLSPFPVVRLSGRVTRGGARIRLLSVRAPVGTRIQVRCRGRRCPRRQTKRGRGINRPVRFRRFQRAFRAGTVLEVRVTRAGAIGKFTRFRIRRGRAPARRDLCLRPGANRGSSCPD